MSFDFVREGVVYHVHTEVGEGAARVVVDEQHQPDLDMESSEENPGA